jgi:hypothetical protein
MNACAVAETQYLIWDDYLKLGPLKAIDVVRDIAGFMPWAFALAARF